MAVNGNINMKPLPFFDFNSAYGRYFSTFVFLQWYTYAARAIRCIAVCMWGQLLKTAQVPLTKCFRKSHPFKKVCFIKIEMGSTYSQ